MYSILSGIIFAMTLLYPEFSITTMGTFLIPLYFKKQKIWDGFIWGLLVFITYWWWLLILLQKYQVGIVGYLFYSMLILWCTGLSSIWLYFFNGAPTISTTLFFLIITQCSMIFIGTFEGMPLINPLVLLSEHPIILWPLPWLRDTGMLLFLFSIQTWIAQSIKNKNIKRVGMYLFIITSLQFITFNNKQELTKKIPDAAVVIPWWYQKGNGMFCGYRLSHDICKQVHKSIPPKIIITPESTFCFDLLEYKNFIPIWCESANNIPILLAGHSFKNNKAHNCIFLLHNNEIIYRYFKKHNMPLVEKSLWFERLLQLPMLSHALIPNDLDENYQKDLILIGDQQYQLFICSEFFFESKKVSGDSILLLWNDMWLCSNYAKKLALLFIKYFEKKYKVTVYHVATSGLTNIKF